MKKLIALGLATIMGLSLVACSSTATIKQSSKSVADTIIEASAKIVKSVTDVADIGFVPSPSPYDTPTPIGPDSVFVPSGHGSERQNLLNYSRSEFGIKYIETGWTHTANANIDIWVYDKNEDIVYFVSREYVGLNREDAIAQFLANVGYTINIEADGVDSEHMIGASDGSNIINFFCTDKGLIVASVRPQELTEWQNCLDTILKTFVPSE